MCMGMGMGMCVCVDSSADRDENTRVLRFLPTRVLATYSSRHSRLGTNEHVLINVRSESGGRRSSDG